MLDSGKMIGFVATTDYDRTHAFYVDKLGFEFVSLDQFALVLRVGGHTLRIAKVPEFTAQQFTVLGWEVSDVEAVAKWLRDHGVETEKFPWVTDKELGIWSAPGGDKIAWFKDPDGNVLSISQHAR